MMRFRIVLQKVLLIGLILGLSVPDVRAVVQGNQERLEKAAEAFRQGERLYYQGDFEAARQKFREAVRICDETPDKFADVPGFGPGGLYLSSLDMVGLCYQYLDELDQALAVFHEVLRLVKSSDFEAEIIDVGTADALNLIGWALYLKGEYDQAIEYLQEAERVCPEKGRDSLRDRILIEIGVVYSALGNYSLAYKYLQEGLRRSKLIDLKMEQTRGLQHLGNLERSWGNLAKALQCYEQAVRVGREAYDVQYNRAYLVDALSDLGALYGQLRRYDEAHAAFREALDVGRQLRTRRLIARSVINLGNLARDQGNLEEALDHHQQVLSLSEEVALRPSMGLALAELGHDLLRPRSITGAPLTASGGCGWRRSPKTARSDSGRTSRMCLNEPFRCCTDYIGGMPTAALTREPSPTPNERGRERRSGNGPLTECKPRSLPLAVLI